MEQEPRFSSRVGPLRGSNPVSALMDSLRAAGRPVINLAESNPTRCGLSPGGVMAALADPASLSYSPDPRGLPVAREALAARLDCGTGELFLAASTSEAYSWLFKLACDPGDAVLVPKPGYPLFDWLAGLEGVRAQPYRLGYAHGAGWRIDLDALRDAAVASDARALVVIHPNNPTGSYLRDAERRAVVELCAERGMALISDEVFRPYAVEAARPPASLGGERDCLCFSLDGLSKLLCLPQLKLGWIRASGPPAALAGALARLEIIADTYLSAGAPAMNALPALLAGADSFVDGVRQRLARNLASARRILGEGSTPYRVLRCDGGWTAIVECPRLHTDEELALRLLEEEGVAVQPGYLFDFEREGYLAVSLILPPERFDAGVSALRRCLDRMLGE